jgi:hypothetical protein
VIFSFVNGGVTVTEAGISSGAAGTAFRLYTETSSSIRTGIAMANPAASAAAVTLELYQLDGSFTGLRSTLSIPANGQVALFLNQIPEFGSLPADFRGVLRLASSTAILLNGLRGRYNERNDFLITTLPPVNEAAAASSSLFFPHIVDSGGYTTQFILIGGQAAGTLELFSQSGELLGWILR